jgi:hypothetical protein
VIPLPPPRSNSAEDFAECKEAEFDGEVWYNHDVRCHGPYEDMADEDEYAEGFLWLCCEKLGDDEGCKFTKHKAKVNLVQKPPVVTPVVLPTHPPPPPSSVGVKKKAEDQIVKPELARCENCQTI